MRVWIDNARCQNSGLCEEEVPELFAIGEDFVAYVRQDGEVLDNPGGEAGKAFVPENLHERAKMAAEACPAECIHLVQ